MSQIAFNGFTFKGLTGNRFRANDVPHRFLNRGTSLALLSVSGMMISSTLASSALAQGNICYDYDALARLEASRYSSGAKIDYTLDAHGNREQRSEATSGAAACYAPSSSVGTGEADPGNNASPIAVPDYVTVDQHQSYNFSVLSNDSDADGNSLIVTFVTESHRGTAGISSDRTKVTYTAGPALCHEHSPEILSYTVEDQQGGLSQAQVAVTYNPTPFTTVTQSPTAHNDAVTLAILPTDPSPNKDVQVLANDTDPEQDRLHINSVYGGNSSIATYQWTPGDQSIRFYGVNAGTTTFTYTVIEKRFNCTTQSWQQLSGTSSSTVTVTVTDPLAGDPGNGNCGGMLC